MALVRLAVGCALAALLCAITSGMPRHQADHPDNQSANPLVVPQAHVAPHTITLPVVDGKGIRFTRLSTEEGLSQTKVSQIVQDDQGFMWFGSQYGLNRYDGYKFKVFKHEPGRANSLSGVYIYSLFKDRSGSLWIGCDEFLDKLNPVTETFTHYRIDTADPQGETVPITNISQDHAGMLWLSTLRGLFRFDPSTGRTIRYHHDPNNPFSLSSDEVKQTGEDRTGTFWVVTNEGLDAFDRDTGKVTLHVPLHERGEMSFYEDRSGVFWIVHVTGGGVAIFDRKANTLTQYSFHERHLSDALPTGMMATLEDRDGTLWFGTMGDGILKLDRKGRKFIRYRNDPADPESLGENNISALFQDREGNIWAGLHMMAPNRFSTRPPLFEKFKNEPGNPNSLSGTMVNGIYEDREGILWISAIDALQCVDRKTGRYTSYRTAGPDVSARPTDIVQDRSGFLWIGSDGHGLTRFDPKTGLFKTFRHNPTDRSNLSSDLVTQLLIDHRGTLWATTFDGLDRFDPATSHFTAYKRAPQSPAQIDIAVKEDPHGTLWIGTHSSGLQRFDPAIERFTASYKHDAKDASSLSNNRVNSVHFDRSGTMWVGTQDGLDRFDAKAGGFKTYNVQNGLSGNVVSCILEDERGNLWMSTNDGLSVFHPLEQRFENYSVADGLPGADLTGWGSCSKSSRGEMFFGGFSGGVAFYPDRVAHSPYVPPIVLTDFRLFDRPVTVGADSPLSKSIGYTDALSLSHDKNVFSLEFSALSYFNPATNRYRYKLEGLDSQWHQVGSNQRLVTYTTLPPSTYTFRVQAATSRGAWSEPGLALSLNILPPWWGTWWFRAVCVAVSITLLWGFYRWRTGQLQSQQKQLRDVINTVPANVWSTSPDGAVDFVNQRWQELTGLPAEEALGWNWEAAVHPEDRAEFDAAWRAAVKNRRAMEHEVRVRRSDGEYRWLFVRNVPLRDKSGKILKWYGTSVDIEERKRAEQALRRSEDYLAEAQRLNRTGSWAVRPGASKAHYWSDEMFRIWGFDPQHGIPDWQAAVERVHPDERDMIRQAVGQVLEGHFTVDGEGEHRLVMPDGTVKYVHALTHAIFDAGNVVEYIGTNVDVTERKHAEEERERLRQVEADLEHINRVSMMGELAASLAHEIKQPIAAVATNAKTGLRWLQREPPDPGEAREALSRIVNDAKRAADIIERNRSLYQRDTPKRETVNLNEVVREIIVLLQDAANRQSVSIRPELDQNIPTMSADRVQMQQVLMNLMLNGIEAMKDTGGELTIRSKKTEDRQILISVSDAGVGLPGENANRVFDAFFTTKAQGTGMGLSICRRIIESHGGRLWACANAGRGTTFHLSLPAGASASATPAA